MILRFVIKKLYEKICDFYSLTFSSFNFFFLKDKRISTNNNIYLKYYDKRSINDFLKELKLQKTEERYQRVLIIKKKSLKKLLNFIFTNEFKNYLFKTTGFRYSIDYLFIYQNKFLSEEISHKSVYANKPHYDKPFSKNMLKLIIPIDLPSEREGALIIMNDKNHLKKNLLKENHLPFLSPKTGTYIYGFNPRKTYHFALPPKENLSGINIMLQLNPSKNWLINNKIIERQFKIEPNFPELRNIFSTNTFLK